MVDEDARPGEDESGRGGQDEADQDLRPTVILADTTPAEPVCDHDGVPVDWAELDWHPSWWDALWGKLFDALIRGLHPESARMAP